jgi:hypothetical protein
MNDALRRALSAAIAAFSAPASRRVRGYFSAKRQSAQQRAERSQRGAKQPQTTRNAQTTRREAAQYATIANAWQPTFSASASPENR